MRTIEGNQTGDGLRIAVVVSKYHDFVTELERSVFSWRVHLVDARVQGHGADEQVERALRALAARGVGVIALGALLHRRLFSPEGESGTGVPQTGDAGVATSAVR